MAATKSPSHISHLGQLIPFREAVGPKVMFPGFDASPRHFVDEGMEIECNHVIKVRDGVDLRADIYLPAKRLSNAKLPVVLAITPYGKQNPIDLSQLPAGREYNAGFDGVIFSKYTLFEGSDPAFWTKQGFAFVAVDSRGSYASEGTLTFLTKDNGCDAYDVIEYLGTQPWSNGSVGMIGASALGVIQWHAASLHPPHLRGIIVQDGFTDFYREVTFKGGILHANFLEGVNNIYLAHGNAEGSAVIDLLQAAKEHPHYDEFWRLFSPEVEKVNCPVYLISSLADNGVHTPGSIRGFLAVQSSEKYMELHPYLKWEWQLTLESLERQAAFFNKVLNGPDRRSAASVDFWPPVRLHVTEKAYAGSWRSENEFPLARTKRTKFFLSHGNQLADHSVLGTDCVTYVAITGSVAWQKTFSSPTEITGTARLHLTLSISEGSDADLFVTLQKLDREGNMVYFPYHSFINDGYVAWGWLKASKRKLADKAYGDEVAHTFLAEDVQPLRPGEKVQLDISIQPSSTLFRKGESIRVVVQGRDFNDYSPECQIPRAGTGCNQGKHTIFLEGSYVEVPIIPYKFV